jgi:hypothetical protein
MFTDVLRTSACCVSCWRGDQQSGQYDHAKHKWHLALRYRNFSLPQSFSASRFTAGRIRVLALDPMARAAGTVRRDESLRHDPPRSRSRRYGETRARHHSTKTDNGIPIVTTFSSVSSALMEQLIFEFASLSSCPTNCTDFLRNLISIRTAILHYLNKYRTIAATGARPAFKLKSPSMMQGRAGRPLRTADQLPRPRAYAFVSSLSRATR